MTSGGGRRAIRFSDQPQDRAGAAVLVVLDPTWTAPATDEAAGTHRATADDATAAPPVVVGVRDVAARVLARLDLIVETSTRLDSWAATSGIVDVLTIRDTSFWFYVRLRHWLWLEERILWAAIVDEILRDHGPSPLVLAPGVETALRDVLRLVAERDGVAIVEETAAPSSAPESPGMPSITTAADSGPATTAPPTAVGRRRPSRARRLLGRLRNRVLGPPPPPPAVARRLELKARVERLREMVDALAAEPESRLLVVHEHARQRVDTPDGPRSMNPYLDPIVDRLRGTVLEPIVLDIRARAGNDAAWERIGAGRLPRILPADAIGVAPAAAAAADASAATEAFASSPPMTTGASLPDPDMAAPPVGDSSASAPDVESSLAAWRDALHDPIDAFGMDLGPLLAAEVAATAARFLPGMAASIDRIERFLERLRPAAVLLADEYHRQDWMAAARSAGIPVAAVQHGMISAHHNGYIHASRPASLRLPDRTYLFGRWERDLLRTASVYRDDELRVGGSPRLDLVSVTPESRRRTRRALNIADDDRLVVVSGTWGSIYRGFHYPIALAALVDRPLPRIHFVIKLHPGETDEGPYRQVIEAAARARGFEPPAISTIQSIDLYVLLAAADAHLGIHSTVLTEAVVTRTPNLLAVGLAGADVLGYVDAGVARPVRDGGDLLRAVELATSHAMDDASAAAFRAAHFEPGSASDRIATDLIAWLT